MVLQHEYQHGETILQTLQLKRGSPYVAPRQYRTPPAQLRIPAGSMVRFPGGRVLVGTVDRAVAYDNERPCHEAELAPFWIDAAPVRNGEFLEFMPDGGYRRRELWSDEGWEWVRHSGAEAPAYWRQTDDGWCVRTMDCIDPLDYERPVCHVCYYEAEAFAHWAGKRLPTEFEWEAAAAEGPGEPPFLVLGERLERWGEFRAEACAAHLSTLFPEVRPRGYYEVRTVDALDPSWYAAPLAFLVGLVWQPSIGARALEISGDPDPALLRLAGQRGLDDARLGSRAQELFLLALEGCASLSADVLSRSDVERTAEFFERFTSARRSPASEWQFSARDLPAGGGSVGAPTTVQDVAGP